MTQNNQVVLGIKMEPGLLQDFESACKKSGASKSKIVKQAILAYIEFVEKNPTSPFQKC